MSADEKKTVLSESTGLLIVLSGPSGVGKGTICKAILARDSALALSVSATTRERSPSEVHGKDYYFCSEEEFQELLDQDDFLEWADVHGHRYGTIKSKVEEILSEGKDCLLEIDVQGGIQVIKIMGQSCLTIFIKPPSEEELLRRITGRNRDKPEDIKRRMTTAQWEMTQEDKYRYTVVNDVLEDAVEKVLDIIRKERRAHAAAIH